MRLIPLVSALPVAMLAAPPAAPHRPNILFIMSDGQAHALGAYGSTVNQIHFSACDEDRLANGQMPNGVDRPIAKLRGR